MTEVFACRRCPAKFPSNTKLHEHVRNHHAKKLKSTPATPQLAPIASPKLSLASAKPTTSKSSRLLVSISSTLVPCASSTLSQTPPLQPERVLQPQPIRLQISHFQSTNHKPHIKRYLTIDNLFAMFRGKYLKKSMDTIQTTIPSPSPRQTRITAYFKPVLQS